MMCRYGELRWLLSLVTIGTLFFGALASNWPVFAQTTDCDISWGQIFHDSFNTDYRSIVGPTTPGTTTAPKSIKLRVRVAQHDITGARVRVWNDRTNTQTYYDMSQDNSFDNSSTYDWWTATIPLGTEPTILYYLFELNDAPGSCTADQDFYADDNSKFYGGGTGAMYDAFEDAQKESFQISIYDPNFHVPGWMQRAIIYQIFPDRFRDGDSANNPPANRFFYDERSIVRSNQGNWNYTVCDPRETGPSSCRGKAGDNFYGGDLKGIVQKINDGYFDNLGVTILYLNPIFRAPSNHKYDTADYMKIDPDFGTLADFQDMIAAANNHGIRIMLDGVFNHVSADSKYFDLYSRYDSAGNLTSPSGPGTDDDSGACESGSSPYYSWFYFPGDKDSLGLKDNSPVKCKNGTNNAEQTYTAWGKYFSIPKLRSNSAQVRSLIWSNGINSVGPYWISQGASAWRFDVGGDIDPGLTNDPTNNYWEGFRAAVRNSAVTGQSDVVMLGEEWGDASAWLLGNEWDSVMNYRLRSALLSWLFTGCVDGSNGCAKDGSADVFWDNDSNAGSSSGDIRYIGPSQFNARLLSIWEDYPPMAWKAMMNLAGSHDTNRLRFLLKKGNDDDDATAAQRMKEWYIFAFTYAGAPTIYYGDEMGLNHDGVWVVYSDDNQKYEDDPYNRLPFPWPDASGSSYVPDTTNVYPHMRKMASIRLSYRALQDGDVHHGLVIDDAKKIYGFGRTYGSGDSAQRTVILLNRSNDSQTVTVNGLNATPYNLPDGIVLTDILDSGTSYTVSDGSISVIVPSNWGRILIEQGKADTPATASGLSNTVSGANRILQWNPVVKDTAGERELAIRYDIYRDTILDFTPSSSNLRDTIYPPDFGSNSKGKMSYTDVAAGSTTYYYKVRAYTGSNKYSTTAGF